MRTPPLPSFPSFDVHRPPTISDALAESPSVQSEGPLRVAWRLVAPLTFADLGPFLALGLAVGCLCRALAAVTQVDLDAPRPGSGVH